MMIHDKFKMETISFIIYALGNYEIVQIREIVIGTNTSFFGYLIFIPITIDIIQVMPGMSLQ